MDMLVKLYDLPNEFAHESVVDSVRVRRAMPYEKEDVVEWVRNTFGDHASGWPSECAAAFANSPVSCYIATDSGDVVGFAAYDVTSKGFFGPTGVAEQFRGRGIGKALLLHALHAMRMLGYSYAIIGGVGPTEFYRQAVGAIEIPESEPGVYRDLLSSMKEMA